LSEAVAVTVTAFETVDPPTGAVIETVGATVSLAGFALTDCDFAERLPPASYPSIVYA
jgi:hypothetical protein